MNLEEAAFDAIEPSERRQCLLMAQGKAQRLPMQHGKGLELVTTHYCDVRHYYFHLLSAWGRKVAQMEAKAQFLAESGY